MTLAELVPMAAARAPHDTAVVGTARTVTWAELDGEADRLARTLAGHGVGRGDRVAIARLKDVESFIAAHAIVRAGAAVVPIDPLAPAAAARQVLDDAEVAAVVGDARTLGAIEPWSLPAPPEVTVASGLDTDPPRNLVEWSEAQETAPITELPTVGPDDLAYLIYTSGSTGVPKGIVHTHASAMAYVELAAADHGLTHADRIAGTSPLHFDMSTLELYVAPYVGASVVVMSEALLRFPASFTARAAETATTVWYTVPFLLRAVSERGALADRDLSSLRLVMYGGEPYPPGALRELMEALPHATVVNVYGPAEVNACTTHTMTEPPAGDEIPIGRPWGDVEIRIVDGQLWVSAPTVMAGYWHRDDLTARSLEPRDDGPPWYATGDVVDLDDDGLLWFRGRVDHQVKVRGMRIELEGVESVLTDAPGVLHAVAGPDDTAGEADHLVAAIVAADGEPDLDAIRAWCASQLPAVAVPARIDVHRAFPATASGKIDRRAVRSRLATDRAAPGESIHRAPGTEH